MERIPPLGTSNTDWLQEKEKEKEGGPHSYQIDGGRKRRRVIMPDQQEGIWKTFFFFL